MDHFQVHVNNMKMLFLDTVIAMENPSQTELYHVQDALEFLTNE